MTALLFLFLALIGYFLLVQYYRDTFPLNTWINGVYCTGKSVEEVNRELLAGSASPIVTVTDGAGKVCELDLGDMNYVADYRAVLEDFLREQSPWLWIVNFLTAGGEELVPIIAYSEKLLEEAFLELPPVREILERKEAYELTYTQQEGYQLYDGMTGRLDAGKALEALELAIERGETEFSLAEESFYYDVPLSREQEETKALWEKLEAYYRCDLVYDMGAEQVELSPALLSGFLAAKEGEPLLDADGNFILKREAVEAFAAALAEQYDTYQKEREFQSTRGELVTVKGGTYGTQLNQKKETQFLLDHLLSEEMYTGRPQLHVPAYKREGYVRGLDDIGSTYIEIDMTEQKLYCYVEGELVIETDVVTGNVRRGMSTPSGINYVYAKQQNRILRGEGYASPVDYWMPVKGGIGIHDADWRDEFGGEIYKTSGSHGCINVPPEIMPELYERTEVGMPVIMFY